MLNFEEEGKVTTLSGLGVAATTRHQWAAFSLLGAGLAGIAVTVAKNVAYALRSDVDSLPGHTWRHRAIVAYLHFLQPFARFRGQVRGVFSPAEIIRSAAAPGMSGSPRPSLRDGWRALLLVSGNSVEDRYWSETWTTSQRVLDQLTDWLRQSRAVRVVEIDEGWSDDRDVSVLVGRWAWVDVRALVEDHGGGKGLLRVSRRLRPTSFGVAIALGLAAAVLGTDLLGGSLGWPTGGAFTATSALLVGAFAAWRTAQATAIVRRGIAAVALRGRMVAVKPVRRAPLYVPDAGQDRQQAG